MSIASSISQFLLSKVGVITISLLAAFAIVLSVVGAVRAAQRQHCVEQWANDTVHRNQVLSKAYLDRENAAVAFDQALIILLNDISPVTGGDPKAAQQKFYSDLTSVQQAGVRFNLVSQQFNQISAEHPIVSVDLHC